jgi:type I restriction enzyme S subunit
VSAGVPLKRLVSVNERALPESTDLGWEFRYLDIAAVGRGMLQEQPRRITFGEAPSRARRLVRCGDTILSTVRTYLRAVWPVVGPTDDLVVSTGFAVLTPGPELDPRYLGWLAQSDVLLEAVIARSVGVSYPAINPAEVGDARVPKPSLREQRSVADFLATEAARIDALIGKRRRMAALVLEREQAQLLGRLSEGEARQTIKQFGVEVCTGPFGTQLAAEEYVEDGVPVINPSHIRDGQIVPEPGVAVPSALAKSRLAPHQLRRGDIVMGRKGDVGRAALVTEREEGWVCGSDSIAIRTEGSKLSPEFLATVLHLALFRQQLESRSSGATMTNVNEANLLALHIPVLTLAAQRGIAAECHKIRTRTLRTVGMFTRQIELLKERRQALITAAVTGELDVTKGVA